jgi:flavin reductase (DIM6/NTAB) family NADH-FMN oxidoreductase RutF
MFYEPALDDHGLRGDPLYALVVPRPIGWISTRSRDGTLNLAPYSFFSMISDEPPIVLFSSYGPKDSASFALESGEFVANLVSESLAEAMNQTSIDAPRGASEFTLAGLTPEACRVINAPRVKEAYAALECRVTESFRPRDMTGNESENIVVLGQVVGVHIDDRILHEGRIDVGKARPVARLGYQDYAVVREIFSMRRPKWSEREP